MRLVCSRAVSGAGVWSGNALRSQAAHRRLHCTGTAATPDPLWTLPMNSDTAALVAQIHATRTQCVLYATGGGSQALSDLLAVPGASRSVLDAQVPYANTATVAILGAPPHQFTSADCAKQLAQAAFRRAAALLTPDDGPFFGLACSAALATDRPKAGEHRAHIACHTGLRTHNYALTFEKGARQRSEEERVLSDALLRICAHHCGVPDAQIPGWPLCAPAERSDSITTSIDYDLGERTEQLPHAEAGTQDAAEGQHAALQALLEGKVSSVEVSGPTEQRRVVVDAPRHHVALLPGSFNPVHDGHTELVRAGMQTSGATSTMFELCVHNPDKGAIAASDIHERVAAFAARGLPVTLTNASLFTQKAVLFRNATFVLGYDTAVRIVQTKYYGNSEAHMAAEFARLQAAGCKFAVAGRLENNDFKTLQDIDMPDVLREMDLFVAIPERVFRADISSSEIRRSRSTQGDSAT